MKGTRDGRTGRRRICLVTETYPPEVNGVAMTLSRLVEGLRRRGHAVTIVRPCQPCDAGTDTRGDSALTLVRGMALPGYRAVRIGLPAFRTLLERWRCFRPDVVYVATEGPLGWSAVRAANRLELPLVSGFHTNFAEYTRHYLTRWLVPVVFRSLRRFHNRTHGTLVAGEPLRRQLTSGGFRNVFVLGRGVDSELFTPERRSAELRDTWGARPDDIVVLSVGRLAAEKNLPLALRTFRAMEQIQRRARFVIVGDGPLRRALESANRDVTFSGMLGGESLARHYASADVFLFPSETETFGNVTLEAMASGLAVLAYDYAAAGSHIRQGESGVLVARGDASEYVAAGVALARSPDSISRLGLRARAHAATVGWEDVVERFEALLTRAFASRATAELARAPAGQSEERHIVDSLADGMWERGDRP